MKHNRLDISNREAGYVQTKWTDNTEEKNMADSFTGTDAFATEASFWAPLSMIDQLQPEFGTRWREQWQDTVMNVSDFNF